MTRATRLARLSLAALLPLLSGCLYSHTVRPLTTNLNGAPVVETSARADVKEFDYYVRVVWDSNGIGDIGRRNGFEEVYYADLETLRILGIWKQRWVHVYGRRAAVPADAAEDGSGAPARD